MNKEWFEADKERYQRVWVEPLTALLEQVQGKLAKTYAPDEAHAEGVPDLSRRAVLQGQDAVQDPRRGRAADGNGSAMYLHVETEEEWVGAGTYFFEDKELPKWRKLVAADKTGKEIAGIVGKLRKKGYQVGGHEDYKKRAQAVPGRPSAGGIPADEGPHRAVSGDAQGHAASRRSRGLARRARQGRGADGELAASSRLTPRGAH